tara:strand:- start:1165 stop:1533 length:369 start_codon:yes stop_codon:yes gene_type:complete
MSQELREEFQGYLNEIHKRLNELEDPAPNNDFRNYFQPLAERLGEAEKTIEELDEAVPEKLDKRLEKEHMHIEDVHERLYQVEGNLDTVHDKFYKKLEQVDRRLFDIEEKLNRIKVINMEEE